MIVDTDKTNCSNCKYYQVYKTPIAIVNHPMIDNPGKLYACNGVKGFGIVGPKFYCTNHELTKEISDTIVKVLKNLKGKNNGEI